MSGSTAAHSLSSNSWSSPPSSRSLPACSCQHALASMLLPALAKAKAKTIQTKCTGNQKQLMLVTIMYITDSEDFVPHPNWDFDPKIPGWLHRQRHLGGFGTDSNMVTGVL